MRDGALKGVFTLRAVSAGILVLALIAGAAPLGGQTREHPMIARSTEGMVVTASDLASSVGAEILRRGGNAVDAAVAVGLAMAVTYPGAGNLGGGGFMLIRLADGTARVIDYRETAPAWAYRGMYLDSAGGLVPGASTDTYLAVGVPGTVAGLALALEKFGTMPWKELVEPALLLAEKGFRVSRSLAGDFRNQRERLMRFPESCRIFLRDGNYYNEGDTLRQPELAGTLRRLQVEGPSEFYEGLTARLIAGDMAANGGLITADDLKNYRPLLRQPITGTYRGYQLVTIPPVSAGGVALLEMLNILENFNLAATRYNSPAAYHILIETMRRAYADRAHFMGDPAFARIPVAGLISKEYAKQLALAIDTARATPSALLRHGDPPGRESFETTHFSIVDARGNAVANTYTINDWFGNGAVVRGAGFFLNNEMDDFAARPGTPNMFGLIQGDANAIEPLKRPLSSISPVVGLKGGHLSFVLGSPGGPTIPTVVLQVILNIIDHRMSIGEAIAAPRLHHQYLPDAVRYESSGFAPETVALLEAMGHNFQKLDRLGDVEGIMVEEGTGELIGASDPRSPDAMPVGD